MLTHVAGHSNFRISLCKFIGPSTQGLYLAAPHKMSLLNSLRLNSDTLALIRIERIQSKQRSTTRTQEQDTQNTVTQEQRTQNIATTIQLKHKTTH